MGEQLWLESVRQRLTKHDLPSSYVQRFTEELGDHLEDLKAEGAEADASSRLGEPEQVAQAAVTAYRRRSFLGRHPVAAFLVFAASPVIPQYFLFIELIVLLAVLGGYRTIDWYRDQWILGPIVVVCSILVVALYGELAKWLGIGKKWTLVSCAVLGAVATLFQFGISAGAVTVMLPVQFAAPLAMGWWFTRPRCNHGHAATTFLVFAISPLALYWILLMVVAWAFLAAEPLYYPGEFGEARFGPIVGLVLAFVPLLLLTMVPTVVPSLFYCTLVRRSGIGRKWILVSCTVLAMHAAILTLPSVGYAVGEFGALQLAMKICMASTQCLIPLAIGWWFIRRKHDQGRLELAS